RPLRDALARPDAGAPRAGAGAGADVRPLRPGARARPPGRAHLRVWLGRPVDRVVLELAARELLFEAAPEVFARDRQVVARPPRLQAGDSHLRVPPGRANAVRH